MRPSTGILAIAIGSLACGSRTDLVRSTRPADGMGSSGGAGSSADPTAMGGAMSTNGACRSCGAANSGGTNGRSDTGTTPAGNGIPVCTYSESGPEYTIAVSVDPAKANYHLTSAIFKDDITCPVGVENPRVVEHVIDRYDTLRVQTQSNGLIHIFYLYAPSDGPGYSYGSYCSVDGIEVTQLYKVSTLYVRFTRANGSRYRVDIAEWWNPGSYAISFYPMDSDTSTAIGTQLATVANANGTATVTFVDMENRRITIQLSNYGQIVGVTATYPW